MCDSNIEIINPNYSENSNYLSIVEKWNYPIIILMIISLLYIDYVSIKKFMLNLEQSIDIFHFFRASRRTFLHWNAVLEKHTATYPMIILCVWACLNKMPIPQRERCGSAIKEQINCSIFTVDAIMNQIFLNGHCSTPSKSQSIA